MPHIYIILQYFNIKCNSITKILINSIDEKFSGVEYVQEGTFHRENILFGAG